MRKCSFGRIDVCCVLWKHIPEDDTGQQVGSVPAAINYCWPSVTGSWHPALCLWVICRLWRVMSSDFRWRVFAICSCWVWNINLPYINPGHSHNGPGISIWPGQSRTQLSQWPRALPVIMSCVVNNLASYSCEGLLYRKDTSNQLNTTPHTLHLNPIRPDRIPAPHRVHLILSQPPRPQHMLRQLRPQRPRHLLPAIDRAHRPIAPPDDSTRAEDVQRSKHPRLHVPSDVRDPLCPALRLRLP